ncbi:MAG: gamma-glutamylcyclotransferase [Rubricella sp.]
MDADGGFWVFGYGSLIWRPGFPVAERKLATLHGWRRSFCMKSVEYRGTPEKPGLVLALDREEGARCTGLAFRVAPEHARASLDYLRARELVTDAYHERRLTIRITGGRALTAYAYTMNRDHWQYAGALPLADQAEVIATAVGPNGPNAEYLHNTVESLRALGLHDEELETLERLVRAKSAIGMARPRR